MNVQKQKKVVDPVQVFAEKVRDHKELESRWAVLQDTRIEYFKGKDFVSLLQTHTELRPSFSSPTPTAANTSVGGGNNAGSNNNHSNLNNVGVGIESEEDLGNLLLKRKLILRCDRVLKTPRPGKTKLSKWPARLELYPVHAHNLFSPFLYFYPCIFCSDLSFPMDYAKCVYILPKLQKLLQNQLHSH